MKQISKVVGLIACIALVGFGCARTSDLKTNEDPLTIDRSVILLDARNQGLIMNEGEIEHMKDPAVLVPDSAKIESPAWESFQQTDFRTWKAAALADVTGGTSYGLVHILAEQNTFRLAASFGNLGESVNGSSFRAWLVKRGDGMKRLDLGSLEKTESGMVLTYASKADLREYDFFVVTLQSEGSTAPGEHILEGTIR